MLKSKIICFLLVFLLLSGCEPSKKSVNKSNKDSSGDILNPGNSENILAYVKSDGKILFNSVFSLSDGTFLVSGQAEDLNRRAFKRNRKSC